MDKFWSPGKSAERNGTEPSGTLFELARWKGDSEGWGAKRNDDVKHIFALYINGRQCQRGMGRGGDGGN